MTNRIALLGRLRSGKDWVANLLPHRKIALGFPLYEVINYFYGRTYEKNSLGYRDCLKKVGQWGRGVVNEHYPLTIERMLLTKLLREEGQNILSLTSVSWKDYGKDELFWVRSLWERPEFIDCIIEKVPIIITDTREEADINFLRAHNFDIYLVL